MKELEFLKKAHDQILDFSSVLSFDKTNLCHFNLVALQGSIIELSSCIVVLLDNNGKAGIPSVFRKILETFAELTNLAKCKTYIYCMKFAYNKQLLHLLQNAKKGNPFLEEISCSINLDSKILEYQEKNKKLSDEGYRELKASERFEVAGMKNEYDSLYNSLSCDAHSNIRSLISRHVEFANDNYQIVYYRDEPAESFINYIDSTVRFLVNSAIILHKELNSDKVEELSALVEEYNSINT